MIQLSTGTTTGLQKITPEQKIQLAAQWDTIASEYPPIIEQAVLSGVKPTAEYRAYEASYGALDAYLHGADGGILVHMDTLSFVEPAEYQKVWNAYYSDKAKLLLLVAVPPTNQVTDITLSATPQADKTINVTLACKYTQGFFRATHIVLYRTSATSTPRPIDTASAHAHVIPLLPNAPDNHEYTTTINLPQVSGNVQLHYRFAITAAYLGSGALALHKDGIVDGGADWRDVTVDQPITGNLYNYWNYDTGELRAGKKDNYIKLNPDAGKLNLEGIKIPQVEQDINRATLTLDEKIKQIDKKLDENIIKLFSHGYIQWPGEPAPNTIYSFDGYEWEKIDYDGCFFRAEGKDALPFDGGEQGDAIRNITASAGFDAGNRINWSAGAFAHTDTGSAQSWSNSNKWTTQTLGFDASRVVPTAEENRPRNRTIVIWRLKKL